ncbi:hypothetical protein ACW4TU_19645 [Streptomyces sp. QTS52]
MIIVRVGHRHLRRPAPWQSPSAKGDKLPEVPAITLGFGAAADGASCLSVYQVATVKGVTGVYRSDDAAKTWRRINDDQHQWGWLGEAITGDPRIPGMVYLATNGRGIQFGQTA